MQKGKIASQCCHGTCNVIRRMEKEFSKDPVYKSWLAEGQKKIILKATEQQLRQLIEEYKNDVNCWCLAVYDAGLTQISPNSLTVVAFRPTKEIPAILKKLKLL